MLLCKYTHDWLYNEPQNAMCTMHIMMIMIMKS